MTELLERLAEANPVRTDDLAPAIDDVWRKLDDTAARQSNGSRSVQAGGWWRRRAAMRWATVGVAAVAAAVALLVVGTTGGGPASAFAGWSADPTTPPAGQVQTAESYCLESSPQLGSTTPALVDTRGPWTVLIYPARGLGCMVNPSITHEFGDHSAAQPFSLPGLNDSTPLDPAGIAPMQGALLYAGPSAPNPATGGTLKAQWTFTAGRVGADVTGLTVVLPDGTSVEATVANGWFAAWWPEGGAPQAARITTATGTTTQPFYGSPNGTTGDTSRTPSN